MGKLYLRQRLPIGERSFAVTDPSGTARYLVEVDLLSIGQWIYIQDTQRRELALIQKKSALSSRSEILAGGAVIATIQKKFLRQRYEIEGPDWTAERGVYPVIREIAGQSGQVAVVRRTIRSWGEAYELDIADGVSELMALAVTLAIDFMPEEEASSPAVIASTYT